MAQTALQLARRNPAWTFGLTGGGFALAFILLAPVRAFLAGRGFSPPPGLLWLFVVGGFLGGYLLARLLWGRLGGAGSPSRGTLVGALVGLLSLPVPFYALEVAVVVARGNPFEPVAGASPFVQALSDLLLFVLTPILLGVLGLIPTYGSTVALGAFVGYLLARE
ncbi:uncharacterized protein HHUB_4083 (plasmid) [Halobacterium hubeiense]|uniref:Uncharacterized protein n=1 Tax=Halobacterium hubeiense TaxID=1407499 RepID=A0A0U5H6P1_9EURY|nr:hypothetical protein [Halobacterium hubeiense]CQH63445.1 uncharacterized protein HHUB_4083 [Halobacterium hubeiense]